MIPPTSARYGATPHGCRLATILVGATVLHVPSLHRACSTTPRIIALHYPGVCSPPCRIIQAERNGMHQRSDGNLDSPVWRSGPMTLPSCPPRLRDQVRAAMRRRQCCVAQRSGVCRMGASTFTLPAIPASVALPRSARCDPISPWHARSRCWRTRMPAVARSPGAR